VRDLLDLGEPRLSEPAQPDKEARDVVAGYSVVDIQPPLLCFDEPRSPKDLQVSRGVGDRESGLLGEHLDATRALTKQVEQLETLRRRDGFPELGQLLVHAVLEPPVGCRHCSTIQIEHLNSQQPAADWFD
jgi:hypothetical protein